MINKIESTSNPKYKSWLELTTKKGIKNQNQYLISGRKLIKEFTEQFSDLVITSLSSDETSKLPNLEILSKKLLQNLSPNHRAEDILVVKSPEIKTWSTKEPLPKKSLLVPVGDPANLGAILRSAFGFGVEHIILLEEAAHPLLPKSVKAASGATNKLQLYFGPSIQDLSTIADQIYALDKSGETIGNQDTCLPFLIGEEGKGIPDFNFKKVSIATRPELESLNANVAASILLYENFKIMK